jgi:uncharacterized protein
MSVASTPLPVNAQAETLAQHLPALLLGDDPHPEGLLRLVEAGLGLSGDDARATLFDTVAGINARLFPPITKLELIHTEGCNLGCTYCFEAGVFTTKRMPVEIGRAAIDLLFAYSREAPRLSITHFGGEPLVNFSGVKDTTEYAEVRAHEEGKAVTFSMTSNGVLLDRPKAEYLATHGVMVLLSIDGLKEAHDRYRIDKRGRGTFNRVMEAVDLLKETQGWVGAKITVMPENAGGLVRGVVGLYERGVNQFVIGYATGVPWPDAAKQGYAEQWHALREWYGRTRRDDLRITDFDVKAPSPKPLFVCQAGNDSFAVGVDGQVSPCSKVLALGNRRLILKLGDVHHGLTHLRNRLELTTGATLRGRCLEAGVADGYPGGCWATNNTDTSDVFSPSMQDLTFNELLAKDAAIC